MQTDLPTPYSAFLSSKTAGRREYRFAMGVALVSAIFFLVAVPYAKTPQEQVPAFIPIYVSFLILSDLITSALLFSQFSVLRSKEILILAGGYLFSGAITAAYALIFPGLFPFSQLPVACPQTSSAMYMFWHAGFPLMVMAYVLSKPGPNEPHRFPPSSPGRAKLEIAAMVACVLLVVGAYTLFATWGHAHIPVFLDGNRTTEIGHHFLLAVWMLSLLALCILWMRKPHTTLDVWLIVVMCVWLFDIALAAILNTGRYDLGWYLGRIYGMLAASFLLMGLLIEHNRQYAQLVHMSMKLSVANQALAELSRQDGLTGLANRRHFDEYLQEQAALACRNKSTLALVMCDVDHFKAFNDHYGHQAGDACLQQVALALRSCCQRPTDLAARYGGEEFALILPNTELAGATQVAEAVRQAVLKLQLPHAQSTAAPCVSVSAGVGAHKPITGEKEQTLIHTADRSLYEAKRLGRNQVVSTY